MLDEGLKPVMYIQLFSHIHDSFQVQIFNAAL